jgi:alpha-tubulin suppressor-like RCC1 family protein
MLQLVLIVVVILAQQVVTQSHFISAITSSYRGHLFLDGTTAYSVCVYDNNQGWMGIGSTAGCSLSATVVSDSIAFANISYGYQHVLGLTTDGTVLAWGYNNFNELGNTSIATGTQANSPVIVNTSPIPAPVTMVCAGQLASYAIAK